MPRKSKKEKLEKVEKKEDESELEEEIEEAEEEADDNRFVEFLQPVKGRAPVLERTLSSEQLPNLEIGVAEATGFGNEKKEDANEGFKYLAGKNQEEPKYIDMGGEHIIGGVAPMDVISLGRGNIFEKQNVAFRNSEPGMPESQNMEKYTSPERFDIEKAGKGNVFEKRDIKYKPSR